MLYSLIFLFARKILEICVKIKVYQWIIILLLIHPISLWIFHLGWFHTHRVVCGLISIFTSMSLMGFLIKIFNGVKSTKIITYISLFTFEAYLVHEFFLSRGSVYGWTENKLAGFLLLTVLSLVAGWLLYKLSNSFSKDKALKQASKQ